MLKKEDALDEAKEEMRKKLKRRDTLGKVESVADIDIEDYFFYL